MVFLDLHTRQGWGWHQVIALMRPRFRLLSVCFSLMVVNRVSGLVLPASTQWLVDDVMRARHVALLPRIICIVIAAALIQGLTSFALTELLSKSGQRMISDFRRQLQQHIGLLPMTFHESATTGSIVSRIMTDVEGIKNLIGTGVMDLIGGITAALIASIYLVRISPKMTLLLLILLLVFVLLMRGALAVIRVAFHESAVATGDVAGRLTQSLNASRVVKSYVAEGSESRLFGLGVARILQKSVEAVSAQAKLAILSIFLLGAAGVLTTTYGAQQVLHGQLTIGGYASYTAFVAFLITPMLSVVNTGMQLTEAFAGLERMSEILALPTEETKSSRGMKLPHIKGSIDFHEVCFEYSEGRRVLDRVSFEARPGTMTALVGASGSGKSTILSLICAFHDATSGKILIDGQDLSSIELSSYRSQLGVVFQETFLFSGSIRNNILFHRPDASEKDFHEACQISHVDEFVQHIPEGYDALIGEQGVKLSGGQRQRLSIARAVLAAPRILLLDEATSSLDSESEWFIQEGLRTLMSGRTTLVIAHRLSTIRQADQILVVENGRLVESGRHEELLKRGGRYRELYDSQYGQKASIEEETIDVRSSEVKV